MQRQARHNSAQQKQINAFRGRRLGIEALESRRLLAGELDPTFGNQGLINRDLFLDPDETGVAEAVAVQPDGKMLVAGRANGINALVRLNTDGTLDTTFGTAGRAFQDRGTFYDITLQDDGKIVTVGPGYLSGSFAISRYNANGLPDATFDGDGEQTIVLSGSYFTAWATSVVVQSDGRIAVAGAADNGLSTQSAMIRLNANGSLDTSFANAGQLVTNLGRTTYDMPPDIAIAPDGSIFVTSYDYFLRRVTAAGVVDTTFVPSLYFAPASVAITNTGSVIVAGGGGSFELVGLSANGARDFSFGVNGRVTSTFTGSNGVIGTRAFDVTLDANGRIVVAGQTLTGPQYSTAIARYHSNGVLDNTFDFDGRALGPASGSAGVDTALRQDGKIVTASGLTQANLFGESKTRLGLAVFNDNGSIAQTFGSSGVIVVSFGFSNDAAVSIATRQDGKVVVAGTSNKYRSQQSFLSYVNQYNADGTPDISFGQNGQIFVKPITRDRDLITDLELQPDGKMVLVGTTGTYPSSIFITRRNIDGSVDSAFGVGGTTITSFPTNIAGANSVALQSDGKIIVVGSANTSATNGDMIVLRYNVDGTLDSSFDNDGWATIDLGYAYDKAYAVKIQLDGKIVLAGTQFSIVRLNSDGSLDATFNGTGSVLGTFGSSITAGNLAWAHDLLIQPDGRIVVGGKMTVSFNPNNSILARFNSDGSLDTTFDQDGKVDISSFGRAETIQSIQLDSSGKIVAAGSGNGVIAISRFNTNGSLDTTFDGDGRAFTPTGNSSDNRQQANALTIQADSKILVAGQSFSLSTRTTDYFVARYMAGNPSPVAVNGSATANEDSNAAILLSAIDPNNDSLTYSIVTPPQHGTLVGTAPNLTYLPAANYFGSDSFTFLANDGSSQSNIATFSLIVIAVNDAPAVASLIPDQVVTENSPDSFVDLLSAFSDVDDASLTYTATSSHDGLVSTSIIDGQLVLHYAAASNGTARVTVTATDSGGLVAVDQFDVTILNAVPTLTVTGPLDGFLGVQGQSRVLRFAAADSTSNGARPFEYEINWGDGSPSAIVSGPALLEIGHTYASAGAVTVQVRVTDPDGGTSLTQSIGLSIQQVEYQGADLALGGTSSNDVLLLVPSSVAPTATITLNSASIGTFSIPSAGVKFFGGVGSDIATMNGTAGNDVFTTDGSSIVWNGTAAWPQPLRLQSTSVEKLRVAALGGNDDIRILAAAAEVIGGAGSDRLFGPAAGGLWQVTGIGSGALNGQAFFAFESLIGGSGIDQFSMIGTGAMSGTIDGGGGLDTIDYSGKPTAVAVNLETNTATSTAGIRGLEIFIGSPVADKLIGPSGANLWRLNGYRSGSINSSFDFSSFETLIGSSSNDTFLMLPTANGFSSIDGRTGRNTLSYAAWNNGVNVNLSSGIATAVTGKVANITVVMGGQGNDQLTGNASASSILIGAAGNDTLTGGSGRDLLIGGDGSDTLFGGSGDDVLVSGRTTYDNDAMALLSILDEWTNTSRSYQTRVRNIRGTGTGTRLNGNYFLQNAPIQTLGVDPGTADSLWGGVGQDWFITDDATDLTDRVSGGSAPEDRDSAG